MITATDHGRVGSPMRLEIDTAVDLSTATQQSIEYRRPDGTMGSWSATISGTGTLVYAPIVSQWSGMRGDWVLHGKFSLSGVTDPYYTEAISVRVLGMFE